MDDLRAKLPDDEETFLGEFLYKPAYHEPTYEQIGYRTNNYVDDTPYYTVSVRRIATRNKWLLQFGPAEVILVSGEAIPVKIVRIGYAHPSRHAVKTGGSTLTDASIDIDGSSLSQEQAEEARFIVQRLKRGG